MDRTAPTLLRVGDWIVNVKAGEISRNDKTARVEARTMQLLLCLAEHAGEVVSIDDLLNRVWAGVNVAPDSVYQAVTSLRRLLGDDPKQPTYIATVPRLGYRMIAKVSPVVESSVADRGIEDRNTEDRGSEDDFNTPSSSLAKSPTSHAKGAREMGHPELTSAPGQKIIFTRTAAITLCLALIVALGLFFFHSKFAKRNQTPSVAAAPPQKSIAVLPFLDLTEGMKEEEFADGMTEELIGRLSKVEGFRVPAPTSSFYFKGKQIPVAGIAQSLGVVYVLDGSVRKSGGRLRVSARLMRPDNGYVVWSESYDRPFDDLLMVQDDIAGEVTKALKTSIETKGDGL